MKQSWVNDCYSVGVTADVPPGAVIRTKVGQLELSLFNLYGEFFVRVDACDGSGHPLSEGRIKQSEVECAGCGSRMSIAEETDSNPGSLSPTMVVDDEIFAWIEKTFQKQLEH